MDEQTPMPETLDTLAMKIAELGKAIDARFVKVDQQFAKVDQQFAKVNQQFAKVNQQFAKVDQQFAKVDQQFAKVDQQFADVKTHLEMKIEAVRAEVHLVYDVVIAQQGRNEANDRAHEGFTKRLEDHEVRILALEPPKPVHR
jgi:septal ring factor EnvC (AmiA/AmiB activator)